MVVKEETDESIQSRTSIDKSLKTVALPIALWNERTSKLNSSVVWLLPISEASLGNRWDTWFCSYVCACLSFSHCPSPLIWPWQVIHDFLFSLKESPEKFQIEANFPRRVLPCIPSEEWPNPPTLQEAGLSHTEVLFVQDLTDEWHFFFLSLPTPIPKRNGKKQKQKREIHIIIIIIQYFF